MIDKIVSSKTGVKSLSDTDKIFFVLHPYKTRLKVLD